MPVLGLEQEYIEYLDEIHWKGYAKQLWHDDEEAYYKGMRQFLTGEDKS